METTDSHRSSVLKFGFPQRVLATQCLAEVSKGYLAALLGQTSNQ